MTSLLRDTRDAIRNAGASEVLERRTRALSETDVQVLRAAADAEPRFVGHAAVFDSRTAIGNPFTWGWYEEIARGAFDKTLAEGDQRFLVDHDTRMLIARRSAGDLNLGTDQVGVTVDAGLDQELSYVRDLTRNLDKRRITGMSIGFYVVRDEWTEIEVDIEVDGVQETATAYLRKITEIRLLEVSAVTFPAYEDTDAGLRAMTNEVRAARGIPEFAPDKGVRPAPAEATRDTQSDPAPAEATRGVAQQDERAAALAVRYRLPR